MADLPEALRRAAAGAIAVLLSISLPGASRALGQAEIRPAVAVDQISHSEWREILRDGQGSIAVTRASSRRGAGALVTRTTLPNIAWLDDGRGYEQTVTQMLFDCRTGNYGVASIDYYMRGRFIDSRLFPGSALVDNIGRDRLLTQLAATACAAPEARTQVGTGTGWLAARGYIITASHVVSGAKRVQIFQEGKRLGAAEVVRDDPANDVAVLKPLFGTSNHAALRISPTPAALGQRVFTLGYPLADELGVGTVKMTAGDVSSMAGVDVETGRADDRRYLQVSIPVQGGNSGGPVIAPDGSVVGLIVSKMQATQDDEIVQNVNFALKASYIRSAMEDLPPVAAAKVSTARGDTAALVAGAQSGVFLVVAEYGVE